MKKRVRNYRNYDGKEQCVPAVGARTGDNAAKRLVKRTADSNDKLYKSSAAARCEQSQQEPHSQKRINYPEDVINNLRDARERSRALHFALSVNDLINCLRTKLARDLIYLLRFTGRCFYCGAFADFRLDFAFNLTLDRFVLRGTP